MTDCAKFKKQINRIKGQINGVDKMVDDGRETTQIVHQISAVRAALSRLAVDILKDDCSSCFAQESEKKQKERFEELVINFFKVA
jgi:DNA-binding FrmR family transcriptional regulator